MQKGSPVKGGISLRVNDEKNSEKNLKESQEKILYLSTDISRAIHNLRALTKEAEEVTTTKTTEHRLDSLENDGVIVRKQKES
jgi:hypothetical protein